MLCARVLLSTSLLAGLAVGQAPAVAHLLKITDGVGNQALTFGLDPCATDGLDPCVGEPNLPPLPPLGAFDVRFIGHDIGITQMDQGTWVDIRQGDAQTEGSFLHELSLQLGFGTSWTLSWQLPNGVDAVLEDLFGGVIFHEVLLGNGQVEIFNPALNRLLLQVTYGPPHPLYAQTHTISLASGGSQSFELDAGPNHAGQPYLLAGSLSGTEPGFDVDGQHLPLNPDAWFLHTLGSPNTPPLNASFGSLDASGRAHASIDVPAGTSPTLAGLELHHAFVSLDLSTVPGAAVVSLASNAVPLELVP